MDDLRDNARDKTEEEAVEPGKARREEGGIQSC